MGKGKKSFIPDKRNAQRFRLIPSSCVKNDEKTEECQPTKEQIEEQHKYGVFFDDNYDYLQHMRDRNESSVMLSAEEERTVVRAPSIPFPPPSTTVTFDEDVDKALDGSLEASGDLEDDFITLAGGIVEDKLLAPRMPRPLLGDSDEEDEDDEEFNEDYDDYEMDEDEEEENAIGHDGENRDVDNAFDALLEADYDDEKIGDLDAEAADLHGGIEPTDFRIRQLIGEKRINPEYDGELAKKYVRDRMKYIEKNGQEEMEEVEVEVPVSKKMKWDCESFATQYSNIYNRPSLIKEGGLSKRALKRLDKASIVEEASEEEDEEMEDDDESVCTTATTVRRRGETTEERKMRKGAVKEARRVRREEKAANKRAFALEHAKAVAARVGVIKGTTML